MRNLSEDEIKVGMFVSPLKPSSEFGNVFEVLCVEFPLLVLKKYYNCLDEMTVVKNWDAKANQFCELSKEYVLALMGEKHPTLETKMVDKNPGPFWPDLCEHGIECWAGTVSIPSESEYFSKFDVYVYDDFEGVCSSPQYNVCIRVGKAQEDYISAGVLQKVVANNEAGWCEPYPYILPLLRHWMATHK